MPHGSDRRELICDAALQLAADGGNHAVTHSAVDKRLGLPKGSTSYYFRTREALVTAAIVHLTEASRAAFDAAVSADRSGIAAPEDVISDYLIDLVTRRQTQLRARYAFAPDAAASAELRTLLSRCLFTQAGAVDLMTSLGVSDPESAAADLVSALEGLAFDLSYGQRSLTASSDIAAQVRRYVRRLLP